MNRAEIDRLMYQQDHRWANIVQQALRKQHPAAKRAAQFLKHDWSQIFAHWREVSPSVQADASDSSLVDEILDFVHNSLYPAALAAGFPDTSFVFPDIELHDKTEATYPLPTFQTAVSGPHGGHGGHGGGGFRGGAWRRRPGRRHFDVGPSYAYPPPWAAWPDDPLIVELDEDADDAFVSGSGDPWEAVLGATSEPVRHGVLATVAPVLAPATSAITFKLKLDEHQRLTARVCVDGRCYEGTINLGPVIREVLDKAADFHKQLHAREAQAAQVVVSDRHDHERNHRAMSDVAVSGDAALTATEEAIELAGELLVDKVVDHHIDVVAAGWWGDIKKKVSSAARGVQHTIAKHKGAIAVVAAAAAGTGAAMIPGVGPLVAPLAASAAQNMVNAASGDGDMKAAAKQALAVAQQAAKKDKRVAKALSTAQKAVTQTTAAYHVADTIASASEGDPKAAQEVLQMTDAAKDGDPAAKVAMDLANQLMGPDQQVSGEINASIGHWLVPLALGIPAGAVGGYFSHDKVKQWLESHLFTKQPAVASGAWSDVSKAMFARGQVPSRDLRHAPAPARAPARRVEGTGKPILISVLSEDGALTDRLVMWHPTHDQIKLFGGKIPAYYTEDEDGMFLFADRHGDKIEQGPLAGKRFKSYHPTWEVRTWDRTLSQELADELTGTDTASAGTPPSAVTVGAEAALATLQEQARSIASRSAGNVVGVVRSAAGQWYAPTFASGDDADDWLGRVLGHPTWFTYAAYFDKGDMMWPRALNEAIGRQTATVARRGAPIQRSVATVGAEAGLTAIRRMAHGGAAAMPGDVIGIVRRSGGTWGMYQFKTADDADDWFGSATSEPSSFIYAAYFDKGDTMWPAPLNEAVGHAAHPQVAAKSIHRNVATT